MILLSMLLGQRPFKELSLYETIPATQILAESAKCQLEEVLEQLAGPDGDFSEYRDALLTQHTPKRLLRIPEGPLPRETPPELFLLVAGLLHPHPKMRLSVSEALGCPFLQASECYEDEVAEITRVARGAAYEEVSQSLSRLERIRGSSLNSQAEGLGFGDEDYQEQVAADAVGHQPLIAEDGTESDDL